MPSINLSSVEPLKGGLTIQLAADSLVIRNVATKPVDFRKGHDALASLVQSHLQKKPFDGAVYVTVRGQITGAPLGQRLRSGQSRSTQEPRLSSSA